MFFFTTPTKKENESTTPKTEINESPYDYQKQLDFELDKITETRKAENKKRKKEDDHVYPTVITDKYSMPIFMKENGDLVEVTTQTINNGPYFYENGDPVLKTNLSAYFDSVKNPRTNGGKGTKGRKTKGKRAKGKRTKKLKTKGKRTRRIY
jgi:hypothetical protein